MFDENNIKVLKFTKKKLRKLAKVIDESEIWMANLESPAHIENYKECLENFKFYK